jgi:hypothetical protein
MNRKDDILRRLADAARQASLPSDPEPPIGFVTRAIAGLKREPGDFPGESLVWSSVAVAAVVCLATAGWEGSAPKPDGDAAFVAQLTSAALQP